MKRNELKEDVEYFMIDGISITSVYITLSLPFVILDIDGEGMRLEKGYDLDRIYPTFELAKQGIIDKLKKDIEKVKNY